MDEVLDHEQRRRPIIELFTPICANINAHLATARAEALGLGQFVMPGLAWQMGRQAATAMRSAALATM